MTTFRQLLREFWLPFLIASIWTVFLTSTSKLNSTATISAFVSSFFLASWATGQFVRVRKQRRVEKSFSDVEDRVQKVAENLEEAAQKIVSTVTGGDSYCRLIFTPGYETEVLISNEGEHPLYDVQMRVTDLTIFQSLDHTRPQYPFASDVSLSIGDIAAGMVTGATLVLKSETWTGLNVFFHARNGNWTQMIRRESPGSPIASRIRWVGEEVILVEDLPSNVNADRFEHGW